MKIRLNYSVGDFQLSVKQEIAPTGITVLAGPSGAGKTSLLRCLAGFNRATGLVEFGKQILQNKQIFMAPHLRQIGLMSQSNTLFSHLTVLGNLAFAKNRTRTGGVELDQITQGFGIEHLLQRSISGLSGGEIARVSLARSLLSNPRILLLDEPFAALDEEARVKIAIRLKSMIVHLQIPVLMIVHDFGDLCRLADHVLYLQDGKILAAGRLNEALIDPILPFYQREDACMVLEAKVNNYDKEFALSNLDFGKYSIQIPTNAVVNGAEVRLRIRAADVSISRQQASNSSIINTLPVTITKLHNHTTHPGQKTVILDTGSFSLMARVTAKSIHELDLKLGDQVFARIKASAALLY
ncbi:MAG: molybdenum ABC transporter ATP-binding protein [Robiginitomaculum sp.]|nr:molybdenum ABC transporter ATP-binding protein [Robiginitomaculum sp.]